MLSSLIDLGGPSSHPLTHTDEECLHLCQLLWRLNREHVNIRQAWDTARSSCSVVPLLLGSFPEGFELQFATSSVGSVVSCPRLVNSSFLRNLSTRDGEKPYIAAMRPRFEMPFGYFFGILFCYFISLRFYLLIWNTEKSKPSLRGDIWEPHVGRRVR